MLHQKVCWNPLVNAVKQRDSRKYILLCETVINQVRQVRSHANYSELGTIFMLYTVCDTKPF